MAKRPPQLSLDLPDRFGWGGARPGAGRTPVGAEAGISHRRNLDVDARFPVHVSARVREHVWNLRSRRCYCIVAAAFRAILDRDDFRVIHFSIQGNHIHFILEAETSGALANGLKSLLTRIAMRLNVLMGTRGRVFEDRYHAHVLRTLTEVRHAIAYVLGNFARHARRRGEVVPASFVDPYSSAAPGGPDGAAPPVSEPRSWLLRNACLFAKEPVAAYAAAA